MARAGARVCGGLVARILASGWTCFDLYRPRYDVTVLVG